MKNRWHLMLVVLAACSGCLALGGDGDLREQIRGIKQSALTSHEVDRGYVEKRLLNLLGDDPDSESRAIVYAAIASLYGADGDNPDEKAVHYAREALKNRIGVIDACEMYLCLGRAAESRARRSGAALTAAEIDNQARPCIQGLAFVLDHLRIDKRLPPPGVMKYDIPPGSPRYEEIVRQHEKEMAIHEDVTQQNGLLGFRDNFVSRVRHLYPRLQLDDSALERVVSDALSDTTRRQRVLRFLLRDTDARFPPRVK